jgi:hypothetical protein
MIGVSQRVERRAVNALCQSILLAISGALIALRP